MPGATADGLCYCMNIHPAETWAEVRSALLGPVRRVKELTAPSAPFAVGLRISAVALAELQEPANRDELRRIHAAEGYLPITVNGFPYGPFHGTRVKAEVYQPDWRMPERLAYTCGLADLMVDLAEPGDMVSLSTVPGTFKPLAKGHEAKMAEAFLDAVGHCVHLRDRTGVTVAIAIEPEPFCFLETIDETAAYFEQYLFSEPAVRRVADATGLTHAEAAASLPRHLGLCYDVCHAAVEFEEPAESLAALRRAGIPIHKLQLSAALRLRPVTPDGRNALARFDEPTYLHQVVAQKDGQLHRFVDLADALARGADADGEEWRVHFHVPVFMDRVGPFHSTLDFLALILRLHAATPVAPHLEIETYTWKVLPEGLRGGAMEEDIAKEFAWVRGQLG